jgi:predicted MFS family arabinose efflux permease
MPVAAAWVAAHYEWRSAFLVGAGVAALTCLLVWWFVRPTAPARPDRRLRDGFTLGLIVDLLSRPSFAFTTAVAVVGMYVFQSFVSFFPTFLVEHHGLTQGRASLLFGVAFVLAAVGSPVVGYVADETSLDGTLAAAMAVVATGFSLAIAGTGVVVLAGIVAVGTGLSWGGVLQARFMVDLGADERGTGFGLARTTFILLGSVGNTVTGILADTVGWGTAYGVVIALLALAVCALATNRVLRLRL